MAHVSPEQKRLWNGRWREATAALVGALLTWGAAVVGGPDQITAEEWIALGFAVATGAGMFEIARRA